MQGEVKVIYDEELDLPDIQFIQNNCVTPWQRVSSGISEIVPLVIYVRYYLKPNDLLVIEEPEAHLHPALQIEVAKLFVALVNRGVNILLTTHSQFLLSSLNNHIKSAKLKKEEQKEVGLEPLDFRKVSACLLKQIDGSLYSSYEPLIPDQDGISESQFVEIHKQLYEQSTMIDYRSDE